MSARTNGIGTPSRDQGMNALPPPQQEHPESERVDSVAKEISEYKKNLLAENKKDCMCI